MDNRSDANSAVGSARAANSALGNSDIDGGIQPDSDNSYAEL